MKVDYAALPDGWTAVSSARLHAVIRTDQGDDLAADLRGIADSGEVNDALDLILRHGTRKVPDFVLVDPATHRLLTRGSASAYVIGAGRSAVVQSVGGQLWADVDLDPSTDRVLLYVQDRATASAPAPTEPVLADPAVAEPALVPPVVEPEPAVEPEPTAEVVQAAPESAAVEPSIAPPVVEPESAAEVVDTDTEPEPEPEPAAVAEPNVAPATEQSTSDQPAQSGSSGYDHLFGVTQRGLKDVEGQVIPPVIGADGKAPGADEEDLPAPAASGSGQAQGPDEQDRNGLDDQAHSELTLPPPTEGGSSWGGDEPQDAAEPGPAGVPATMRGQAPQLIDAVPWRPGRRAEPKPEPEPARPTLPAELPVPSWAERPAPGRELPDPAPSVGRSQRRAAPQSTPVQPERDGTGERQADPDHSTPVEPVSTGGDQAVEPPNEEPAGHPMNREQRGDRARGGPTGPTVLAVLCPQGHPSPPHAERCVLCDTEIEPQQPAVVPRPPLGVLRLSTGDLVPLDRGVILGRAPTVDQKQEAAGRPHLVRLPSPENDISRKHVEVVLDGWHVLVRDLGSTNGTCVTLPGAEPVRLRAHDDQVIEPGTMVTLADEVMFTYELAP